MSAAQVLTFHNGKLDVPEELQRELRLEEGAELRVVSATATSILLQSFAKEEKDALRPAWATLRGSIPDTRTPEQQAKAVLRKQRAQERIDELCKSNDASLTELRAAEREWELADDELDFGPFPQR